MGNGSGTVPLYRVAGNDHFYTTSKAERDDALANYGYTRDEGIACYVFETQAPGTVPLYRVAGNDHFYTTSKAERDDALANYGYTRDEGIACYVFGAE